MPTIHPTSIVNSKASLAEGVEIGPSCVIEGPVTIGEGTRLIGHVYLKGPLTIGRKNVLYPFTCVGFEPQDRKFDPVTMNAGVVLGHDNILREGVTIHAATGKRPTTLGDRNFLMSNAHLGHDTSIANDCTLANGTLLGGHAAVADRAIFGGNSAVHQFCRVGRLAMLSGGAVISQDLPPFCVSYVSRQVGSLNLVGLRRAGYRDHVAALTEAFILLYRSQHSTSHALGVIEQKLGHDPLVMELATFCRQSKRGITHYASKAADQE